MQTSIHFDEVVAIMSDSVSKGCVFEATNFDFPFLIEIDII